jgi:hypothetical protein
MRRVADSFPKAEKAAVVAQVEHVVATRFDDLYRRVEHGVRTRDAALVGRPDDSIKACEAYLTDPTSEVSAVLLEGIRTYNEHDVRATLAVHLWLHGLAPQLRAGDLLEDPTVTYVPSDKVVARRTGRWTCKPGSDRRSATDRLPRACPTGCTPPCARWSASWPTTEPSPPPPRPQSGTSAARPSASRAARCPSRQALCGCPSTAERRPRPLPLPIWCDSSPAPLPSRRQVPGPARPCRCLLDGQAC